MSTNAGLQLVDEMYRENWSYVGGENWRQYVTDLNKHHKKHSMESHWNYYNLVRASMDLPPPPPKKISCVCHHGIFWNCYLLSPDKKRIEIVGNCCIKRFTDNKLRTCCLANCENEHRNRKYDLCNFHKEIHKANERSEKKKANILIKEILKCSKSKLHKEPPYILAKRLIYGYYDNMNIQQKLALDCY